MTDGSFIRQTGIFNVEDFDQYTTMIIGCGAIGSYAGLTLSKMGFKKFILVDNDKIERHNIPNQFFNMDYVGYYKVDSLRSTMQRFSEQDLEIFPIKQKFSNRTFKIDSDIVVLATDNMKARKQGFKAAIRDKAKLFIDARMGGETFVVFTVDLTNKKAREDYAKTFHKDVQIACTERAIIYNVLFIAGTIANQIKKVMNQEDYSFCLNGDLKNMMLIK